MKKTPRWLITALLCFLTTLTFAQASLSNYATYSLEVTPFRTPHGNILTEKDIDLQFNNLTQVAQNGDLYIRIDFIRGLKSNYLLQTAIPGTGFAYRIDYTMPKYRVSIIDNNGQLLLQKNYGGEKRTAIFGEFESIASVEDLKFEWEANRTEFYARLESQPEELPKQKMDEELRVAIKQKTNEVPTATEAPVADNSNQPEITETPTQPVAEDNRKRPNSRPSKANVNIYRRPDPKRTKIEDPSEPKLSTAAEQLYNLNGFIEVDACSKYSYQLKNVHPYSTLTVFMQKKPEAELEEVILGAGETKFFSGLPHKLAWIKATYLKDDFQGDQIDIKENLNLIASDENKPRIVTNLLDQFFAQVKPHILFVPKYDDRTDEVVDFMPENNVWQTQLRDYLTKQTVTKLTKGQANKIARETEQLLVVKALRTISEKVERSLEADNENDQKLIYPIIKASDNFRSITPLFLNVKASFESIRLDFDQAQFQAYAIDPEGAFQEFEQVLPEEQFAIQATQLSAGLSWKFYFPLPIFELEGGAFFSHQTRLLWGEDQGQFPQSLFSPENEIISDVVDLSSFRPYFGAKIAVPLYFSGYKFDCESSLRNIHVFAGFRMYPVDFTENNKYNVAIRDAADIDFIPIPLQEGKSKFLMHLMIGGGIEF